MHEVDPCLHRGAAPRSIGGDRRPAIDARSPPRAWLARCQRLLQGRRQDHVIHRIFRRARPCAGRQGVAARHRFHFQRRRLMRRHKPAPRREQVIPLATEIVDFQILGQRRKRTASPDGFANRSYRSLGSRASRSPSPSRLKPNTKIVMESPGKIRAQGALSQ
jgi:hypothetical protein